MFENDAIDLGTFIFEVLSGLGNDFCTKSSNILRQTFMVYELVDKISYLPPTEQPIGFKSFIRMNAILELNAEKCPRFAI